MISGAGRWRGVLEGDRRLGPDERLLTLSALKWCCPLCRKLGPSQTFVCVRGPMPSGPLSAIIPVIIMT